MTRHSLIAAVAIVASAHATLVQGADAHPGRLEYRVIHAAPHHLQQVRDDAGRDGLTCAPVGRPDPDVRVSGVVVTMARPDIETTHVYHTVRHRVVRGSGTGGDCGALLDRSAADGYRLCGLALTAATPGPL